jgi:GTP cyclohydrolase FolE2
MNIKLESDSTAELTKARIAFNIELMKSSISKDAKSNRGSYLSLEALQEATIHIMNQVGLYIEQVTFCDNNKEYLLTTLRHISGEWARSVGYLYEEPAGMDAMKAQECGKIMTYKQRYQWRSILNVGRGSEDAEDASDTITKQQSFELYNIFKDHPEIKAQFFEYYNIGHSDELPAEKFAEAKKALEAKVAKKLGK